MKTMPLLCAVLVLSGSTVLGQSAKGGQVLVEVHTAKKEEKKAPVTPPKPTSQLLGRTVVYGGYFTDLARTEKKGALFNLRAPIDPQQDTENLWYSPGNDSGTNKIQGVVFFSIKF